MTNKESPISLSEILTIHLENNGKPYGDSKNSNNELEIRFGTRNKNKITHINYENIIKKLKSLGFICENENGLPSLKIQNEYIDSKTGETKLSNVRTTISGLNAIQKYCKENKLSNIQNIQKNFEVKTFAKDKKKENIYPINKDDYNMRISYQTETKLDDSSSIVKGILDSWEDSKKTFRYINRLTFKKDGYPFKIDLSKVKSSNMNQKRKMISTYKIEDSGVFQNDINYEIEIELENQLVGTTTAFNTVEIIENILKYGIKLILGGIQETNFPISYDEQDNIKLEYSKLFKGKDFSGKIFNRDFIGPSSKTLQIINLQNINEDSTVPNIRKNYTVTDKADGIRKLLFISQNGKIYLIDTNMNVQFTGCTVKTAKDFAGSLLDGEHIIHNKNGGFINLYAAFDIYFIKYQSVREKLFAPLSSDDIKNNFRLPLLVQFIGELDIKSSGSNLPMNFKFKRFFMEGEESTIFDGCKTLMNKINDGLLEYNTDGLIFTPANLPVGSNSGSKPGPLKKYTWDYSFKWKPPEFNTIDFLFITKKQENGSDIVGNIFQDGTETITDSSGIIQYKTGELHVGFDTKKHGYINPCADVLEDNLPSPQDIDNEDEYKPVKFYPTNPFDNKAHLCRIYLEVDATGNKIMKTLDGEVFENNTIIEFSYDLNESDPLLRWKPLRVRYDKTSEFKSGGRNFGNPYHVANDNWHSIHNPITENMIITGEDIPEEQTDDDVYYNRVAKSTYTRALRDFHNLVVKKKLISSVSSRGDTLIDYAVGKGGDFSKWIASKISFVFGLDISKDNLENKLDGACARYLNYKKQFKSMPYALFVNGNSALNIRDGSALFSEKDKSITEAVFGEGPKDEKILGKGVIRQYGKGINGFNISSCQFALHYFFENRQSCEGFLRNVSECTKLGGYFIGACYDGSLLFNDLIKKSIGESLIILENDTKIWQVTKNYENTEFNSDITSLGYAIDVYQESINKTFREYLVNFEYLTRLMENFGFIPIPTEEARDIGLKSGIGSFSELYKNLEEEVKKRPGIKKDIGDALNMTPGEKRISFYNKYFIFKKIRIVNSKDVGNSIANISSLESKYIEQQTDKLSKELSKSSVPKIKSKKLVGKLKLVN